jgi:RNAse (barnase) inhibitor barstar
VTLRPKLPVSLDDLPSNGVRALGRLSADRLREWAAAAGQRFVQIDLTGCHDKKAVLRAIGKGFGFAGWYGANLDALYDCLTDLPEDASAPGYVVLLEHLPREAAFDDEVRAALLDVFRDAAEDFAGRGIALRVLYS